MKKFELTTETKINISGKKLFRIKALVSFGSVSAGEKGGWVEKEENLSQFGDAWVYGEAEVSDNAFVRDNACVRDNAWVFGNACVRGNAEVSGNALVSGDAKVSGNSCVRGNTEISGDAWVSGNADYTTIHGFGTRFRTTTFFRCKDKEIKVICGCFFGTISEFREQVKRTRKGKIAEEYLMIADLMEKHFKEE